MQSVSFPDLQIDTELEDGKARFEAIHPQRSFIVQAPAGSGKTALLTQRFLALLSQVEAPEQIVAMTFTKKAAAEMQERIYHALQLAQQPAKPDESIYQQNTRLLAQAAWQNGENHQWHLLDNPQRLRIRTLDSMNSALVQQMPLLSRFGSSVSVIEDADALYREAARDALNDPLVTKSAATLIEKVNGNLSRAENLLVAMLQKRDQWMPLMAKVAEDAADEDSKAAFDEALQQLVFAEFAALYKAITPYLSLLDDARKLLVSVEESNWPEGAAWQILQDLDVKNLPGRGAALQGWKQLAYVLLTAKGTLRAKLTVKEGFPAKTKEEKALKQQMQDCLDAMTEQDTSQTLAKALVAIRGLPQDNYSGEQWQGIVDLMQLLKRTAVHLKAAFISAGQTDFIEVAQAASEALGQEDNPTDLAQRLDYQIQHLLIDEFQDTSVSQFALLKKLVAGWQVDDAHSLFIVGDPMQSIYRFREAEVGNFLEVWQGKLGDVALERKNLTVNFRSDQAVVDWVNQVFPTVFPTQSQIERGAVSYSPSSAKKSSDAASLVDPHWAINRSDEQELTEVVALIQTRVAQLESGETIGILGRSRGHLMPIARSLKQQNIAFRAVELETLSERQEIQDAQALTRALLHLSDRPAWLALLRSPAVGLGLADLYALLGDPQTFRQPILQRLADAESVALLSEEGQARLALVVPVLQQVIKQVGYLPWSRLVREAWLALGMAQTVESDAALQNLESYWQMLQRLEADSSEALTFDRLQTAVEKLFAAPDASEQAQRIELMTMHKSKGLEFDTVILPGLGKSTRADDKPLMTWLNFKNTQQDYLVMAPLDQKGKASGQGTSELVAFIQKFEAEKQAYEVARLLYVAATRAKKQLHLFASIEVAASKLEKIEAGKAVFEPADKSLLSGLWQSQKPAFMRLLDDLTFDAAEEAEDAQIPKISRMPLQGLTDLQTWWQQQTQIASNDMAEPADKTEHGSGSVAKSSYATLPEEEAAMITAIGNLVHGVFEQWAQTGFLQQPNAVALLAAQMGYYRFWLSQQDLSGELLERAMARVETSLQHAANNEKVQWALNPAHAESATELALSSFGMAFAAEAPDEEEGTDQSEMLMGAVRHHIVDRTFVDASGTRWIVDYKTSFWQPNMPQSREAFIESKVAEYRPQLARYGSLFAQLEQRTQKFVLYFSYIDAWVEVSI